jgi:methionine-rich copper-binding protein CopC
MPGSIRWLLLAFALAAAAFRPTPHAMQAHALLDHADPPADSVLKQAPTELTLYFEQNFVPASSWVMLRDANNHDTDLKVTIDPSSARVMHAAVPQIAPGAYTVRWQTLSADDDDYAQGSYKLTIANPDGSVAGATGAGSTTKSSSGASPVVYAAIGAFVVFDVFVAMFVLRRRVARGG